MRAIDVSNVLNTTARGVRVAEQLINAVMRAQRSSLAWRVGPALAGIAVGVAAGAIARDAKLRRRVAEWLRAAPPAPPVSPSMANRERASAPAAQAPPS